MARRIAVLLGGILLALGWSGLATAAPGDNLRTIIIDRTGTSCASTSPSGGHGSVGVGIAFNGVNLLASCYSDNTVTENSPADGSLVTVHAISGASSLGAMAWDNGRGKVWACSNFTTIGLIDLATNVYTPSFDTSPLGGTGCFDGLAYDASDDTLWASGDVAGSVQHYSTAGALISSNPVALGCGSSGIAVGGTKLYLANNGCSQIYEAAKDFSSVTLFATFSARLEDLECDNITFASASKAAIWSIDAYDNILNAWEIPTGACLFGGGGGQENTCGEVRGDGMLSTNPKFRFVFYNVRYVADAAKPSGEVSFNDQKNKMKFVSTSIDSLVIAGNQATLTGTGTANGGPVTFTLVVTDGSPDTYSIALSNGYSAAGNVTKPGRGVTVKAC